jgi:large subunit ribosomal protein L6
MSRIGRIPVVFPKEVKVACDSLTVEVTGPKGHLVYHLPRGISVSADGSKVVIQREGDERTAKALHGLARSLVANMVTGVTKGFEKRLEIVGVGYRADLEKGNLKLTLGFSHPVLYPIPPGIQVEVGKQTLVTVKGVDKQQVGEVAAQLRAIKPPEPYKGKGIRYFAERIRKKVGKTKA